MIFYFIRHADPIYDPDSITELGKKQANALTDYLKELKIEKIYSSTSARAYMTALPTSKKLNLECEMLDWAREDIAFKYFSIDNVDGRREWCFFSDKMCTEFLSEPVLSLGKKWYEAEIFKNENFKEGVQFVNDKADNLFKELGFIHDREKGVYHVKDPKYNRVAFFSHGGFSMAFLSSILDIPYNVFSTKFLVLSTTSIAAILFPTDKETITPRIMTFCDNSHLYKEDIKPYHFAY